MPSLPQSILEVCTGCGVKLHSGPATLPGFVAALGQRRAQWIQKPLASGFTCNRCDSLMSPESSSFVPITRCTQAVADSFPLQRPRNGILFLVVDLLDFPGSLLNPTHPERSLLGDRAVNEAIELPTVLIGNKVDLLLNSRQEPTQKLCKWLEASAMTLGMRRPIETLLTSAHSGYGIGALLRAILTMGKRTDRSRGNAFLVGATNVGKSMLWNALMRHAGLSGRSSLLGPQATCSAEPGTTLGYLRVPLRDLARGSGIKRLAFKEPPMGYLYDTPGVYNYSSLISLLSPNEILARERTIGKAVVVGGKTVEATKKAASKVDKNSINDEMETLEKDTISMNGEIESLENEKIIHMNSKCQKVKKYKFQLSTGKSLRLGNLCEINILQGETTVNLVASQIIAPIQLANQPPCEEFKVALKIEKKDCPIEQLIQVAITGIGYATFYRAASIEIRTLTGEGIHQRDVPIQNIPE
jgi:hypothetical protein